MVLFFNEFMSDIKKGVMYWRLQQPARGWFDGPTYQDKDINLMTISEKTKGVIDKI